MVVLNALANTEIGDLNPPGVRGFRLDQDVLES